VTRTGPFLAEESATVTYPSGHDPPETQQRNLGLLSCLGDWCGRGGLWQPVLVPKWCEPVGRLVAAVAVVAAGLTLDAPSAVAAGGQVLPLGDAATLNSAELGVAAQVPKDPRLNGYDFDAQVLQATCTAAHAGLGAKEVVAPPGGQLCVFTLVATNEGLDYLYPNTPFPTTTFTSGSIHRTFTLNPIDASGGTGLGTFAVAITKEAPATLTVGTTVGANHATFSQSMNLRTLTRKGPFLPALYRATEHSTLTATKTAGTAQLEATRADNHRTVAFNVAIPEAALSLFAPSTAPTTVHDDEAYVIVKPSVTATTYQGMFNLGTIPVAAVTLTLPGRKPITSMIAGAGGPDTGLVAEDSPTSTTSRSRPTPRLRR
jgi:hypothetical protein